MNSIMRATLGLLIALSVVPTTAFAAGDSGWVRVARMKLRVDGSGIAVWVDSERYNNSDACRASDYYVLDKGTASDAAFDRFVRILTAAHLANAPVIFWLSGCSNAHDGNLTRPRIYDVTVKP